MQEDFDTPGWSVPLSDEQIHLEGEEEESTSSMQDDQVVDFPAVWLPLDDQIYLDDEPMPWLEEMADPVRWHQRLVHTLAERSMVDNTPSLQVEDAARMHQYMNSSYRAILDPPMPSMEELQASINATTGVIDPAERPSLIARSVLYAHRLGLEMPPYFATESDQALADWAEAVEDFLWDRNATDVHSNPYRHDPASSHTFRGHWTHLEYFHD